MGKRIGRQLPQSQLIRLHGLNGLARVCSADLIIIKIIRLVEQAGILIEFPTMQLQLCCAC